MKPYKEKPARKKFVIAELKELRKKFYLDGWSIHIDYMKERDTISPLLAAEVKTEWAYRRASISIYPPFWTQTDDEKRDCLKHEFCHIVLSQFMLLINDLQNGHMITPNELRATHEHVTSWLEAIIT